MAKKLTKQQKKKRYVLGKGYPWYSDARSLGGFGSVQTTHGLGCIKLYTHPITGKRGDPTPEVIMLDPKGTHNGKKYRLILEEV